MKIKIETGLNFETTQVVVQAKQENEEVAQLINYISNFEKQKDFISIKKEDTFHVIKQSEIVLVSVQGQEVLITTQTDTYTTKGRLYKIIENLDAQKFMQVSKNTVINVDTLIKLESYFSGSMLAILKNGQKVPVSRSYLANVKKYFTL